jgi:hypothetical protein
MGENLQMKMGRGVLGGTYDKLDVYISFPKIISHSIVNYINLSPDGRQLLCNL